MNINTAVILVGGKGTRLYPLTKTRPKPLIPFLNKPIIEYQIDLLVEAGIQRIILALNYFSDQIKHKALEWKANYNIEIIYSHELEPLGTAGPLKLAEKYINGNAFIVMNADIYTSINLTSMITEFKTKKNYDAILLGVEVDNPDKYGLIEIKNGTVTNFIEKPSYTNGPTNIINGGIYIFNRNILNFIELKYVSIEKEIFPQLVQNRKMTIFHFNGIWCDIGVPNEYLKGQKKALGNTNTSNVILGKNIKMGTNIKLKNCTIFNNTIIEDNCIIENAIIGFNCIIKQNTVINDKNIITVLGDYTLYSNYFKIQSRSRIIRFLFRKLLKF